MPGVTAGYSGGTDETTILLRALGHVDAASAHLRNALLEELEMTDDEVELASVALSAVGSLGKKSKREAVAWARSVKEGVECWLIVHCVPQPSETRIDLSYHGSLTREQRRHLAR